MIAPRSARLGPARRADGPAVVAEVPQHLAADGRDGVVEQVPLVGRVEALDGLDEALAGDLLEVVEGDAAAGVPAGDGEGDASVEFDDLAQDHLDAAGVGLGRRVAEQLLRADLKKRTLWTTASSFASSAQARASLPCLSLKASLAAKWALVLRSSRCSQAS